MCEKPLHHVHCNIIPPHILRKIAENGTAQQQDRAFHALNLSAQLRGQRQVLNPLVMLALTSPGEKRRNVYDGAHGETLPGNLVRSEGAAATGDAAADEAYDSAGATYDFYQAVFQRNSLDNRGLRLDSTVHYSNGYNNAFWNGQQMIYGDGDGSIFTRFTVSVDVIAHELTHGITQHEANLVYQGQSGALNEHLSDVFGSLVKQYLKGQSAAAADWLIGQGLLMPGIQGVAIRSLKAPGTAYDDPTLGHDPQPDHMSKYVDTDEDGGGVHINSGIPNKAFYNFAVSLGGNAWDQAGHIWYNALLHALSPNDTFQDCANKTYKIAGDLYGAAVADQLRAAWQSVGLGVVTAAAAAPANVPSPAAVAAPVAAAPAAATSAPAALTASRLQATGAQKNNEGRGSGGRSAAAKKAHATREAKATAAAAVRRAAAKKAHITRTAKGRSAAALKAHATREAQATAAAAARRAAAKKAHITRGAEGRTAAAKKAGATRKAKQQAAATPKPAGGAKSKPAAR